MTTIRNIIFPLVAVLTIVLAGCHHDTASMHELARIDSLVYHQGEKEALPLLQDMDTKGFNNEEKAYYSLLLTMAQYKCYQPFTSDSLINGAVNHYRKSADKVKYLKALVAQGCVNEDMGNLEKAVESYHRAEALSLATDSSMIAYAKLRLGTLYQSQVIGSNTIALEKFKEALPIYKALGDKHYQLVCLSRIGGIYRNIDEMHDSAVAYTRDAIDLAQELGDQYSIFNNRYILSEYYLVREHDYKQSKQYALQAISVDPAIIDHPRAHYRLAASYMYLGQHDSAVYYLKKAPPAATATDSIVYFELMSELEHRYWKDEGKSKNYLQSAHAIADSLTINGLNYRLLEVEKKYDVQLAELTQVKNESRLRGTMLLAALLALALLAAAFLVWRYRNQLKMRQNEVDMLKADLDGSLASLKQMQARLDKVDTSQRNDELKAAIANQIQTVHQLLEWSYQHDEKTFVHKFNEMMTLRGGAEDESYWKNLQLLVNDLYDNVLVAAQEASGGHLRDDELNYLALYCCGFSRTVIMVTMDYSNIGTVYNKKLQIAKKLGVNNLDDFTKPYLK